MTKKLLGSVNALLKDLLKVWHQSVLVSICLLFFFFCIFFEVVLGIIYMNVALETVLQLGLSDGDWVQGCGITKDDEDNKEEKGCCWAPKHHSDTFSEDVQGRNLVIPSGGGIDSCQYNKRILYYKSMHMYHIHSQLSVKVVEWHVALEQLVCECFISINQQKKLIVARA